MPDMTHGGQTPALAELWDRGTRSAREKLQTELQTRFYWQSFVQDLLPKILEALGRWAATVPALHAVTDTFAVTTTDLISFMQGLTIFLIALTHGDLIQQSGFA